MIIVALERIYGAINELNKAVFPFPDDIIK